jgi:DNA relaxase NicK
MLIDWVSITIAGTPKGVLSIQDWLKTNELSALIADGIGPVGHWRPYQAAIGNDLFRVLWQYEAEWSTLAINGQGCAVLGDAIYDVLSLNAEQVTRLDVAFDMNEHSISPVEHAAKVSSRTRSVMESDSGETLYIGSRTSDAFVRMYQYKEPHERAGNTRIESEFKRSYCLPVVEALTAGNHAGVAAWVARKVNLPYSHPVFDAGGTRPMKMNTQKVPGQDGWERWLRRAAMPAVRKAIKAGIIDLDEITG